MTSATELVLGANENIDNVQRLKWNVEGGEWVWHLGNEVGVVLGWIKWHMCVSMTQMRYL